MRYANVKLNVFPDRIDIYATPLIDKWISYRSNKHSFYVNISRYLAAGHNYLTMTHSNCEEQTPAKFMRSDAQRFLSNFIPALYGWDKKVHTSIPKEERCNYPERSIRIYFLQDESKIIGKLKITKQNIEIIQNLDFFANKGV